MKDQVVPIEELERLFQERRRQLELHGNLLRDIGNLESQLATKEEALLAVNENLANYEVAIRDWSKKL